jgi:hypothetical protein
LNSAALALFELNLKGFRLSVVFSDLRGHRLYDDDRDYPSADYSNVHYLCDGCSNVASPNADASDDDYCVGVLPRLLRSLPQRACSRQTELPRVNRKLSLRRREMLRAIAWLIPSSSVAPFGKLDSKEIVSLLWRGRQVFLRNPNHKIFAGRLAHSLEHQTRTTCVSARRIDELLFHLRRLARQPLREGVESFLAKY